MSHTSRAFLFAALVGLALSGSASTFTLVDGLQTWLVQIWADSGDAGSIMDPNGLHGDEGSIMDPDG